MSHRTKQQSGQRHCCGPIHPQRPVGFEFPGNFCLRAVPVLPSRRHPDRDCVQKRVVQLVQSERFARRQPNPRSARGGSAGPGTARTRAPGPQPVVFQCLPTRRWQHQCRQHRGHGQPFHRIFEQPVQQLTDQKTKKNIMFCNMMFFCFKMVEVRGIKPLSAIKCGQTSTV